MTPARRAARKVAHLTLAHQPFDVRVFEKECRTLAQAGYDVHLAVPEATAGIRNGVALHRIERSGGGTGWSRWRRRLAEALHVARALAADLYHVHDPELVPVALALAKAGARVVYDAHEDAAVEAWSMNRGRPLRRAVLPAAWWSLLLLARRRLDAFVAATPHIAGKFPRGRTIVVRNYPRVELFPDRRDHAPGRAQDLVFAGLVCERRGAIGMLDAVASLDPGRAVRLRLYGTIAGDGLAERMRRHPGWSGVDYLGQRPWHEVLHSYRASLAGFLLYEKTAEQRWCMPVKLFEFLLSGLPVIATDIPFWRELLEGNPNVHFVDAADTRSVVAAIEWLLAHPEESARRAHAGMLHARARFDWTGEGERLVALYDRLLE
jgi:glycosyltransferase involved in cell wall biosynthesis